MGIAKRNFLKKYFGDAKKDGEIFSREGSAKLFGALPEASS